jgi:hypothetical protein
MSFAFSTVSTKSILIQIGSPYALRNFLNIFFLFPFALFALFAFNSLFPFHTNSPSCTASPSFTSLFAS